ncbi:MAG TPA: methyltransferase domain-containing protein [Rhizomicrobium sp.]|jgi:predicted Zn-dependent protease/SAM-dependent methyltransferase|nr:methyltransferase domain-containing protein [Rhizomicrobium sp.]
MNDQSLLQKAVAAFQAGSLDEAEGHARALIETAPDRVEGWDLLATILEREGRASEAVTVLQRGLEAQPMAIFLHNQLGLLLARAGRPADAENQLRYALGLDPRQPELAANLGSVLAGSGRIADAENALRTAIALAPANPRYPLLLGRALLAAGKPQDAKAAFAEAIKLGRARVAANDDAKPDPAFFAAYHDALTHMAGLTFEEGRAVMALQFLQEAIASGGAESVRVQFANCLCATTFREPQPGLKPMLARALREAWILQGDLVRAVTPLLLLEPSVRGALAKVGTDGLLADPATRAAAQDPLLLTLLDDALITDPELERLLTALRGALLTATPAAAEPYRGFAVALANQCFINEYAFAETAAERDAIAALQTRVEQAAAQDGAIAEMELALLAAYRPLGKLAGAEALLARHWPQALAPLITRQLREPAVERELAAAIAQISAIDDATSQRVRQQYEENPYPRWLHTPATTRPFPFDLWLRMHFPNLPPVPRPLGPLEILVAGCGTGQEAIGSSRRFASSNVLAVDLSLGSLAYAKRKTAELSIGNIEYAQGDILSLGKLDRRFDVIECAGVLHHLADPLAGWRVLKDLCKPGGIMLMALYSEQGREDLKPAEAIAARGYGTTPDDLRRFRADILALDPADKARAIATARDDFYSLSMLRDLVFHVQEHRFTAGKIAAAVRELGLEFCGFGLTPDIRKRFQTRFGASADLVSLPQWEIFEAENPSTFAAMYHLMVRKPA